MRPKNRLFKYIGVFFSLICYVSFIGCNSKTKDGQNELTGELAEGQKLAGKYCSTCHLPVEPELLDKETWKNQVLPAMAKQLGLEVWQNNHYFQNERSAISQSDWLKIVAYYDSLAPASLPLTSAPVKPLHDWSIFSLKTPPKDTTFIATTTLVAINKTDHHIYTSSAENSDLIIWDKNFKSSVAAKLPSPVVDIHFSDTHDIITSIGEIKAVDLPGGTLFQLDKNQKNETLKQSLVNGLIRPIQTATADFDKDGLTDYVVCSFGHNKGGLYLIKQLPDKTFEKKPIREVAGATQAITGDFNSDGWPDIMALFAHADEGIWLFLNDQKGGFETKNMLRFPPVYGSSSFQLVDVNKDCKPDIVYTAGDNSDYSRILKPYHGLYIFLNKGDLINADFRFEKTYFYPINGATKVIAKDFDLDGDIDFATIAFFADFEKNASESFIYFEQNNMRPFPNFIPHAIPVSQYGRWICMDANDLDGDLDVDIVLGNYAKGFLNQDYFKPSWNMHLPFLILKNEKIMVNY